MAKWRHFSPQMLKNCFHDWIYSYLKIEASPLQRFYKSWLRFFSTNLLNFEYLTITNVTDRWKCYDFVNFRLSLTFKFNKTTRNDRMSNFRSRCKWEALFLKFSCKKNFSILYTSKRESIFTCTLCYVI